MACRYEVKGAIVIFFDYAEYLSDNGDYKDILEEIRLQTDYFMRHFKDDSRFLSGWHHVYFCKNDGGRLVFDIERPDYHECEICGKVYTGFVYDSAHIAILRSEAGLNAVKAALVYAWGHDSKFLDYVKSIVEYYANNYNRFPKSVKPLALDDAPRTGRIMTQAVDEAIFTVRLLCALEIVKQNLDDKWIMAIKESMFVKIHDMLKIQRSSISFDSCWMNTALGIMGLFFNEPDWTREAVSDELGLYEQIEKGVTPDGFWHVGSIHRNFGVLEGITYFFAFANAYGFEVSEFSQQIVIYMYDASFKYAFDNGDLPCIGDGWPGISLKTYTHCFCLACKAFGNSMKKYLRHIETLNIKRTALPLYEPFYFDNRMPLEKLLFAPNDDDAANEKRKLEKRISKIYERAGQAMLRNEKYNVFLKYSHETPRYAHYDKMSIEIMAGMKMLTRDLASTGYMSKQLNDWYRSGMAHNTCVVDGKRSDVRESGRLLFFSDTKIIAECDPYDGVVFRRSIELNNNILIDDFFVECFEEDNDADSEQDESNPPQEQAEHRIEWFFHFENPIEREHIICSPTKALRGPFYHDPWEIRTGGSQVFSLIIGDGIVMHIWLFEGMRMFMCKTPGNPANRAIDTLVLRTFGDSARFRTQITYAEE